ncbi:MAG TPA: hypothetical protein DCP28_05705 [Cytophagales bacterium]|nr:hypothetical protein [Cytophagales bacterium]
MNVFEQLGLSADTSAVLDRLGFEKPTPIQEQAIPLLLESDPTDFIGLAQTGTGKTAAFGLPLLELVAEDMRATQAIVMAPTRELGQQTAQQLKSFAQDNPVLNIEVVYGGSPINRQIQALKTPTQIIVATPGRLLDLIRRKVVSLADVRYVVLDEADEMLNMGFKEEIDDILSHVPEERAIWLFSATMAPDIRRIVSTYMQDPKEVQVEAHVKTNTDITHQYVVTKAANKMAAIRRFLDYDPSMRGIMFCRTKRETQQIADKLTNLGYSVEPLHGDLSQGQRDTAMRRFKSRSMQLLIATDVAARGIDVNDLTHVFHHTLPDQLEAYTHRSGRTGRAGRKGISLVFLGPRENRRLRDLERKIKVTFETVQVPSLGQLRAARINHWANLIINTKVDDQSDEILLEVQDRFEDLTKEDILKRLITTQLDHLQVPKDEEDNLNETRGRGNKDKNKAGEKRESAPTTRTVSEPEDGQDTHRYFVNVGTVDGATMGDLLHFLSDISGLKQKHFTDVALMKTCAYFSISSSLDKGLSEKFNGVEIDDRAIRVNRDDDGPIRGKRPYKKKRGGPPPHKGGKKKRR